MEYYFLLFSFFISLISASDLCSSAEMGRRALSMQLSLR